MSKSMVEKTKFKNEHDLIVVAPKMAEQYGDVTLTSLTAYSLYWLHEWQLPRTIEAVSVLSWRLFPEKFSMVGFAEYPDAFRTNRSLLQMQPKYRNLLTGSASQGFSLNAKGMQLARELISEFGVPEEGDGKPLGLMSRQISQENVKKKIPRSIEPAHEIDKLRKTKLFLKWQQGGMTDRDLIHVHALLGIFDHTPAVMRARAMKDLENNAKKIDDEEAIKFLKDVKNTFPHALSR